MIDEHYCADGTPHDWGPRRIGTAFSGPMEGRWAVELCQRCRLLALQSLDDPASSVDALLGKLEELGCDPQPLGGES